MLFICRRRRRRRSRLGCPSPAARCSLFIVSFVCVFVFVLCASVTVVVAIMHEYVFLYCCVYLLLWYCCCCDCCLPARRAALRRRCHCRCSHELFALTLAASLSPPANQCCAPGDFAISICTQTNLQKSQTCTCIPHPPLGPSSAPHHIDNISHLRHESCV